MRGTSVPSHFFEFYNYLITIIPDPVSEAKIRSNRAEHRFPRARLSNPTSNMPATREQNVMRGFGFRHFLAFALST